MKEYAGTNRRTTDSLVGCNAHSSHGCPLCIYISKPLHTDRRNRRQVCGNREQGNTTTSYGSTCIAITYSSGILNKWKSVESLETVREITDYTRLIAPRCALIETESTNYSVRILTRWPVVKGAFPACTFVASNPL